MAKGSEGILFIHMTTVTRTYRNQPRLAQALADLFVTSELCLRSIDKNLNQTFICPESMTSKTGFCFYTQIMVFLRVVAIHQPYSAVRCCRGTMPSRSDPAYRAFLRLLKSICVFLFLPESGNRTLHRLQYFMTANIDWHMTTMLHDSLRTNLPAEARMCLSPTYCARISPGRTPEMLGRDKKCEKNRKPDSV